MSDHSTRLVRLRYTAAGALAAAEGQVVDREILAGRVDTDTLASSGFTPTQLQAVQQALENTKRALAANVRWTFV